MGIVGTKAFESRLEKIMDIHISAGDISNAEAIGVLELAKFNLCMQATEYNEDQEDGS